MKTVTLVVLVSAFMCTCGGGSSNTQVNKPNTPSIVVSISPSAQTTVDQGQTIAYTATVSNDSQNQGVSWSLSGTGCSGSSCGSFTGSSSTAATYNTPSSVTSSLTVTVTATSITDTTKSASATVVVNPPLAITTSSLASGVVGTAYSATVSATGGSGTLTWSLASGSALPTGLSLSNSGTISGTPTAAGATPFTVVVTDSATTPASMQKQLSITVSGSSSASCGSGNEAVLKGQYAFWLAGADAAGFRLVAGAFTADGTGKITAGEADTNTPSGSATSAINTSGSSYSVGSDNRGCATMATTFGTFTTRFVLGSVSSGTATEGRIIEFEPSGSSAYVASGEIAQQNPSAFSGGPSGNYVFDWAGWDPDDSTPADAVGALGLSGGELTSFEMFVNEDGIIIPTPLGVDTGGYTSFDSSGRATLNYTSTNGGAAAALYMVSPARLVYIQTGGTPAVVGDMQQQTTPQGGFTNASFTGNMVIYGNGTNSTSAADAFIGLANSNGNGSVTISIYDDDGANNANNGTGWQSLQSATTYTCSYSVATTGQVSLSGTASQCATAPIIFLSGASAGVLLGQSTSVDLGGLDPQATITFNNATLSGSYFAGSLPTINQNQLTEVELLTMANGTGTTTTDVTTTAGQQVDEAGSITYTVNSDRTVTAAISGTSVVQMIIINNNEFVMLGNVTGVYPSVLIGQQ